MKKIKDKQVLKEKGQEFLYTEYDKKLPDGTPYSVKERVMSEEELQANQQYVEKANRVEELKELITNKKLLDMDCTSEQAELKQLLGL